MLRVMFLSAGLVVFLLAGTALGRGNTVKAQAPSSLDDETLLSRVLPPLSNGARPPVHLWARADQPNGPGALPTAFVVTMYSKQAGAGLEERETINYVQYVDGSWTPVRPQQDGTLLSGDWAWISANLSNLAAAATGTGDTSQYTVDYDAQGTYAGAVRELAVEEVYGADLSLLSSNVLQDTAAAGASASATAVGSGRQGGPNTIRTAEPLASATPALATPAPSRGITTITATPATTVPSSASAGALTGTPASTTALSSPLAPPISTVTAASALGGTVASGSCTSALSAQGFTWSGSSESLGLVAGQPLTLCWAGGPQSLLPAGQGLGCLLVAGQTASLDGSTFCSGLEGILPRGADSYLVLSHLSASTVKAQSIHWNNNGFTSSSPYTACASNPLVQVSSADACVCQSTCSPASTPVGTEWNVQ